VFLVLALISFVSGLTAPVAGAVAGPVGLNLAWPFRSGTRVPITSTYGGFDGSTGHIGVTRTCCTNDYYALDLGLAQGTPIVAPASGTVVGAGWLNGYGNNVILTFDYKDAHSYTSIFAHMVSIENGIRTGVRVSKGQTIGLVGQTGNAFGAHLHWALYSDARILSGFPIGTATVLEPVEGKGNFHSGQVYTSGNNGGSTPPPPPTPAPTCGDIYLTTGGVNQRTNFGTSNPVITVIPAGTEVIETGTGTGSANGFTWRRVFFNGQSGWVVVDWISLARSRPCSGGSPPPPASYCQKFVTIGDLRFRPQPSLTSPEFEIVPTGTEVQVISATEASADGYQWKKVRRNGNEGYMASMFLKYVAPCVALGRYENCGSLCTQCILTKRPDILTAINDTDTTCASQDSLVLDYCIYPDTSDECSSLKASECANACSGTCNFNCKDFGENYTCNNGECVVGTSASPLLVVGTVLLAAISLLM